MWIIRVSDKCDESQNNSISILKYRKSGLNGFQFYTLFTKVRRH